MNLTLYTTSGNAYLIDKIWIKKYRTFPLFDWILFNPMVELDFEFKKTENTETIDSFKKKLIRFMKQNSYFQNVDPDGEYLEKMKNCNTFEELGPVIDEILQ